MPHLLPLPLWRLASHLEEITQVVNAHPPSTVKPCHGCWTPTITNADWKQMPREWRRRTRLTYRNGDGLCNRCARNRPQPAEWEPEPGAPLDEPHCMKCDQPMVSRKQWDSADEAERAELIAEGYCVEATDGRCTECAGGVEALEVA